MSIASIYGGLPNIRSIDFLYRTKNKLESGSSLEKIVKSELKSYRTIYGYGRPVVPTNERIAPIMKLANQLGYADGEFIKLAFSTEKTLLTGRWRMHMNIGAVASGLIADQGLSSREHYHYLSLCFSIGILTCNVDASSKPEGDLLSLHGWVKTPSFSWLLLASHCILRKWQNIEKAVTQFFDFTYI